MTVICRKEGYKTATVVVDETVAGATFGNIILGGGIGILVDAASGAAQRYPDQVTVWMEPLEWESEKEKVAWNSERDPAPAPFLSNTPAPIPPIPKPPPRSLT